METVRKLNILEKFKFWGIKNSLKAIICGNGCCSRNNEIIPRIGVEDDYYLPIMRTYNPKEANILFIEGVVTPLSLNTLMKVYEEMLDPKIVVGVGACVSNGGPFVGYNTITNINDHIPIDFYLNGCPPSKKAISELIDNLDVVLLRK